MFVICCNVHSSYSPHSESPSTVSYPNPTWREDSLTAALRVFTSTPVCTYHSPSSASYGQLTIPAPTVRVLLYKLSKLAASLTFCNHLLLHLWKKNQMDAGDISVPWVKKIWEKTYGLALTHQDWHLRGPQWIQNGLRASQDLPFQAATHKLTAEQKAQIFLKEPRCLKV